MSINSCVCIAGYYSRTGTRICGACHYSCSVCIIGPLISHCSQCDPTSFREYNALEGRCDPIPGFYDNGVKIAVFCHYSCIACYGGTSKDCLACLDSSHRTYNGTDEECPCDIGFYDDGTNRFCKYCHYSCMACSDTGNNKCTICDPLALR
jgi:hypothetical protein